MNKGDLLDRDGGIALADDIFESADFPHTLILNSYLNDRSVIHYRRK